MTEEEYFRKHYPDVCYNGKPLSPYWDLFQDGTEFGERQSEKKIKELEQKLEQTEKDLADYQFNYPKIKELEKENAELKKINSETLTQLNLDNGELIIENEKLRKENEELKERYDKVDIIGYDALKNLTKAKDHIKTLLDCLKQDTNDPQTNYYVCQYMDKADQLQKIPKKRFLKR